MFSKYAQGNTTDVWTNAPEAAKKYVIATIDKAKSMLTEGNLRALIVLPYHKGDHITLDGVILGAPPLVIGQLEIAKVKTILHVQQHEMEEAVREATAMSAMMGRPKGQA